MNRELPKRGLIFRSVADEEMGPEYVRINVLFSGDAVGVGFMYAMQSLGVGTGAYLTAMVSLTYSEGEAMPDDESMRQLARERCRQAKLAFQFINSGGHVRPPNPWEVN